MNSREILTFLIRAGRDSLNLEEVLKQFGYNETPYFNIHSDIASAIYVMLGEETDTYEDSITYAAMHDYSSSDEECADKLVPFVKPLNIPEATLKTISESAAERGIEINQFINTILGDWAMKEILFKSICG